MEGLKEEALSAVPICGEGAATREGHSVAISLTEFDQRHYVKLIRARGETIRRVVSELRRILGLASALDAGCGVGFFSQILQECGLTVRGFDGRAENVAEARYRFPLIEFEQGDIESAEILNLGIFDFTLCFGLLYHLENPMLAIRRLRALTGKGLLLESMCIPGGGAAMALREEPSAADQSLTDVALYPSEPCLVKMLYRAGFGAVYRVAELPDHDDFRETAEHARRRTIVFASVKAAPVLGFTLIEEPREEIDPWSKYASSMDPSLADRLWRFARQPWRSKYFALANRARRIFPEMPILLRLPFGAWWLAQKSALDRELMHGSFEDAETRFVQKFLRPGMTVVDVGAHHGLYTLLASKGVGRRGKVIAFEPSRRERRRLVRHLRVNACGNVVVEACALGDEVGEADFFVVEGREDWCNSLRPPAAQDRTESIRVRVERLDDVLWRLGVDAADFIKLDAEGAELSVLEGARELLRGKSPRPVILTEVQDIRTQPWGYRAQDILDLLTRENYCWFAINADGSLRNAATNLASYDANLVALPAERAEDIQGAVEARA